MAVYKAALERPERRVMWRATGGDSLKPHKQHDETAKARGQTIEQWYNQVNDPKEPLPEMRNEKMVGNNATIEIRPYWVSHRWLVLPSIKDKG